MYFSGIKPSAFAVCTILNNRPVISAPPSLLANKIFLRNIVNGLTLLLIVDLQTIC